MASGFACKNREPWCRSLLFLMLRHYTENGCRNQIYSRWRNGGLSSAPFAWRNGRNILKATKESIFAVVAPGLEAVCADELAGLGIVGGKAVAGGVEFEGALDELYRSNLWLRTASRLVVRLGALKARDFPDLFGKAKRLAWGKFVRPDTALEVRATSHRSRLLHSGRIAETVAAAADRALGRGETLQNGPRQRVLVRLEDDICQISIDSSGERLHRRGYRQSVTRAPLRETLAAGLLLRLGWKGDGPLVDPMCGSGTLLIEGALLARRLPPGGRRSFAFMDWPGYRPGLWRAITEEAQRRALPSGPLLVGADQDSDAVAVARDNAERAAVLNDLVLHRQEFSLLAAPAATGLLLCNPPYGGRLAAGEDLRPFFRQFGDVCRRSFAGWQVAFLAPAEQLARATGLPLTPVVSLSNGGIPVVLYRSEPPA